MDDHLATSGDFDLDALGKIGGNRMMFENDIDRRRFRG
jgi:hypothetical protein